MALAPPFILDASPQASNGRSPSLSAAQPPRSAPPAVVATLDLERPASGIAALLTSAPGGQPALVELPGAQR